MYKNCHEIALPFSHVYFCYCTSEQKVCAVIKLLDTDFGYYLAHKLSNRLGRISTLAAAGFRFTPPPLFWSSLPESESTSLPDSAFSGTVASSSSSSSSLPPPALLPSLSDELAGCGRTIIRRLI